MEQKVFVYYTEEAKWEEAEALAAHLQIAATGSEEEIREADMVLRLDAEGLSLTGDGLKLRGDFRKMLPRLKHNNLSHESVVKAAKLKGFDGRPTVVDATAGMGEDSLLLAAAGCTVHMYEYNPVVAALLSDTLRRALEDPDLAEIVRRMHLHEGDSVKALREMAEKLDRGEAEERPDLILLDPMFPERKKSSLVKKKLQLIQQLEHPCEDEAALVDAALQVKPRRVMIKRPVKGPFLADRKPSYSITGKNIRYDCMIP
uniref:class I SAM-dependent methyltransferase n=1 Tax=Eubacterium cellulosolvens TaxID=29322 RepID=UPI0006876347|nr:class I SAM-dependent methyltransferase [[Eubacterium] cellulosolvens]